MTPAEQVLRIQSARQAAEASNVRFFINARCDVFFQSSKEPVSALIAQAIDRATLYAQAGADGLFLPGLADIAVISQIAKASSLPLNVLVGGKGPSVSASFRGRRRPDQLRRHALRRHDEGF